MARLPIVHNADRVAAKFPVKFTLQVFDLLGREVATLADEVKAAGNYRATFDARNLPSGTYFYSLKTDGYSSVKSMILVK